MARGTVVRLSLTCNHSSLCTNENYIQIVLKVTALVKGRDYKRTMFSVNPVSAFFISSS